MSYLQENIKNIKERIANAAIKSGRKPEDITLCAVSKTIGVEQINEAISLGVTDIGENKVQEIMEKYDYVNKVKWHLIGHLQTNKVKYIIDKVDLIHSVDSIKLAKEINNRASSIEKNMDILIQVNVSGEESKFGVNLNECDRLLDEIKGLKYLNVKGFMTIAPYVKKPEDVRKYFSKLRNYSINKFNMDDDNYDVGYLSMGMSNDFEVAIEEGANIVRVGTSIFGMRNYF